MVNINIHFTQPIQPEEPVWHFLGEYSLNGRTPDHGSANKPASEWLFQALRKLGCPPEFIENIEVTLTGFTKETRMPAEQEPPSMPVCVDVFCQKKAIVGICPQKSPRPGNTDPDLKRPQTIPPPGSRVSGGWGYFLVERSAPSTIGPTGPPSLLIDLYLYKEGE